MKKIPLTKGAKVTTAKPEKKNYEVLIKAYSVVVVEGATSEDEAFEFAKDEISHGDFDIDELSIERELVTDHDLEQAKRHANAVSEEDGQ